MANSKKASAKKYWWMVGSSGSYMDDVFMELKYLTIDQVKHELLNMVEGAKACDDSWEYGTEEIDEIEDRSGGQEENFYASACFSDYHNDYVAERVPDNIQIKAVTEEID